MSLTKEQIQQYHAMHRHTQNITKTADARARRAGKRCGLQVCKSREQWHINNYGGYQLIDERNCVVAGVNFDLNADDVVEFCSAWANRDVR